MHFYKVCKVYRNRQTKKLKLNKFTAEIYFNYIYFDLRVNFTIQYLQVANFKIVFSKFSLFFLTS